MTNTELYQFLSKGSVAQQQVAITELYKTIYPNLVRFVNMYRNSLREEPKQVAKDILHDALPILMAHVAEGKYQPEKAALATYCIAIAKGIFQNQMRKKDFQFKLDIQDNQEVALLFDQENQQEMMEMSELKQALKHCINVLSEKYKSIIELRFFEELSWKEVAEKMQYSGEHSALMTAKRALDMVKNCLGQRGVQYQ